MRLGYEAVIGLEVHAQLKTASKAFCSCSATYGAYPNVNICPICLGHPGTLPVLNRELVSYAVKMGLATNCSIREQSTFSRKNYFYPDLPKGYQITQYSDPICFAGRLEIETNDGVREIGITRIHMEEDSGKSIHDLDIDTLVDLNRAGVPLIEIVSEPDIRTAHEAYQYLRQIRQIVMYLGICDGNLEEGSLRCDANISVRPNGQTAFGTRREVKNLNSFRNVEKAIEFEINSQIDELSAGGVIVQETLMWDAGAQKTRTMRSKEQAHDYRYFPEPDLVPVIVDVAWQNEIRMSLPELPLARKRRLMSQYGLPAYDAGLLVDDAEVARFYEESCLLLTEKSNESFKLVSNWVMTEMLRIMSERKCRIDQAGVSAVQLASLIDAVASGLVSSKTAKEIFPDIVGTDYNAKDLIKERGLQQNSDKDELKRLVDDVVEKNPDNLRKYRDGKSNLFGFFVGQVLKASGGSANPQLVADMMKEALENTSVDKKLNEK